MNSFRQIHNLRKSHAINGLLAVLLEFIPLTFKEIAQSLKVVLFRFHRLCQFIKDAMHKKIYFPLML